MTIRRLLAIFVLLILSLPRTHAQTFQVNSETGPRSSWLPGLIGGERPGNQNAILLSITIKREGAYPLPSGLLFGNLFKLCYQY